MATEADLFSPSRSRPLVPGETLPLDEFERRLRAHADRMGKLVLRLTGTYPQELSNILNTTSEDIRRVQLQRHVTATELEEWAALELLKLLKK